MEIPDIIWRGTTEPKVYYLKKKRKQIDQILLDLFAQEVGNGHSLVSRVVYL